MAHFRLLLLLLLPGLLPAQSSSLPRLAAAVDALNRDPDMKGASWGITVLDARSGAEVFSFDPHRTLATASTMKIVSTSTALAVLGSAYRFPTVLGYTGSLNDGILQGDLYIRGSGDPSLGSDRFDPAYGPDQLLESWSARIQAAGIREIRGRIVGDDGYFSSQITPGEWPWEDMGNYYGAGASSLNYRENLYRLDLEPGPRAGAGTQVLRTDPALPEITFVNELVTGAPGSGDQAYIYGAPYTGLRYLRGSIPAGPRVFSIKGSIPDPAYLLALELQEELTACGVKITANATTSRRLRQAGAPVSDRLQTVHTHLSPPLSELVRETNMESLNLYAEALARASAVARGEAGESAAAAKAMQDYWQSQGVDTD
ncbi:MAG: D-alanyl-D-alanine carboxypeptidase/D-alanyl-D-alanine-endopeptidase, partial [Bacteroidetes bacterium]